MSIGASVWLDKTTKKPVMGEKAGIFPAFIVIKITVMGS